MITLEVVEELKELEYHLSTYKRGEKNTLIHSEYEDILKKLTDNGRKRWYVIKYYGKSTEIQKELSILKLNNYQRFFVDITMSNPTLSEVSEVIKQFNEFNNCEEGNGEINVTTDEMLCEGEIELLFIVPEYELGWQMHWLLEKRNHD